MLNGIRKATQQGVGRVVMTILLGLLIVAFAYWGVGDMFNGIGSNKVATVGSGVVTAHEFQNELQNVLYRYQRLYKVGLTNAQARAKKIDRQVLEKLIDEAALDQRAHALGLSLSDTAIADAARTDPQLQDATGHFSRAMFDQALRDSGLNEPAFFAQQRSLYLRQQIAQTLVDGVSTPKPVLEALVAAQAQSRDIDYFVLPESAAGEIAAPSPDTLKAFFEDRKSSFRAPEYRGLDIVLLDASTAARADQVSDEDAKAAYDKTKDEAYTVAEKRNLQQMVFASEADADAALAKIKGGVDFGEVVKASNLSATDTELGLRDKKDLAKLDPAAADAAFALPEGGVSDVVKGRFGYLLLRVTQIVPGSVKSFDDVKADVKTSIAKQRASSDLLSLHDKFEDLRVSGKTIPEAAKALGLQVRTIAAVDATGRDPQGALVDLPESKALLQAAFASDIGVDDAALNTHDRGFLWFDVAHVDPAHDRSFDEVKDRIETLWRAQETTKALAAKADGLVKQLDGGANLADIAQSLSLEVKSEKGVKREEFGSLPQAVAVAVFAHGADKAGSAAAAEGRYVFKVAKDFTPPFDPTTPGVKSIGDKFADGLKNSLLDQFVAALKTQLGVKIFENVVQMAEGS